MLDAKLKTCPEQSLETRSMILLDTKLKTCPEQSLDTSSMILLDTKFETRFETQQEQSLEAKSKIWLDIIKTCPEQSLETRSIILLDAKFKNTTRAESGGKVHDSVWYQDNLEMISYYKLMYPTVGTKENQTSIKIDQQHIKKTVTFADKTQVFYMERDLR